MNDDDDFFEEFPNDEGRERLQKVLGRAGFASRRAVENLITEGRVAVNGKTSRLGDRAGAGDRIDVDGVPVVVDPNIVHYLLHKPAGVVSTADDPQGRPTVVGLVPDVQRVYPVGRLDLETEGLLILTNDGDLTQRLTHPSFGVQKEYLAQVEGVPSRHALRQLREGVELDDGMTAPAKVSAPQDGMLKIVIHEGRNRQIRRMCEAVGHPVLRLVRTRIGTLSDASLGPGEWRALSRDEVRTLFAAAEESNDGPRTRVRPRPDKAQRPPAN
ncbi:MAG: 23S rRNA pseudouridine2605 synthase [Candidatus Poriferisodalaceae bacterium]|jgi:23S rRNA pseudouridine2605 synthase